MTVVLLTLSVALAWGVVLAALSGARRGEAAFRQFERKNGTVDASLGVTDGSDSLLDELPAIRALPEVGAAWGFRFVILSAADPTSPSGWRRQLGLLPLDRDGAEVFGRPIVVRGRTPNPDRAGEVAVDEELASRRHLSVGSDYAVAAYTKTQFGPAGQGLDIPPAGDVVNLRVVGIVRYPRDLRPVESNQNNLYVDTGDLYMTPAYWQRFGPDIASYGVEAGVRLRPRQRDISVFAGAVRPTVGPSILVVPGSSLDSSEALLPIRAAIRLESRALVAFAALAALAALLVVGQALARQVHAESASDTALRSIGMASPQLVAVAILAAAPTALLGTVGAAIVAIALSPWTPVGVARRALVHRGVSVDPLVLVAGGAAIIAAVVTSSAFPAWRAARQSAQPRQKHHQLSPGRSRLPVVIGSRFGPIFTIGSRAALLPSRRRNTSSGRAVLFTIGAAVCASVVAGTFDASFERLKASPKRYGVTWDVSVGNFANLDELSSAEHFLDADSSVADYAALARANVTVETKEIELLGLKGGKGALGLTHLQGRDPHGVKEIALGTATLRRLGKSVGDTADLRAGPSDAPHALLIVGRNVLNNAGLGPIVPGEGAVVDFELFGMLSPDNAPQVLLVRLDRTTDQRRALDDLIQRFPNTVVYPLQPDVVRNISRISGMPMIFAGIVAFLAAASLLHALLSSIRARQPEFAVLRALGLLRWQLAEVVGWQATTVALAGLVPGVVLGVAGGRWGWRLLGTQLGVVPDPIVPLTQLLRTAALVLLLANLIALGPALIASHAEPAEALRSE
jgi:hypothetical protein